MVLMVDAERLMIECPRLDSINDLLNRLEACEQRGESGARQMLVRTIAHASGDHNLTIADRLQHGIVPLAVMMSAVVMMVMSAVVMLSVLCGLTVRSEFFSAFAVDEVAVFEAQDLVEGRASEVRRDGGALLGDDGDSGVLDIHGLDLPG
jgi:hypothetical protein